MRLRLRLRSTLAGIRSVIRWRVCSVRELCVTDGSFQRPETLLEPTIGPLTDPRPLSFRPLPTGRATRAYIAGWLFGVPAHMSRIRSDNELEVIAPESIAEILGLGRNAHSSGLRR